MANIAEQLLPALAKAFATALMLAIAFIVFLGPFYRCKFCGFCGKMEHDEEGRVFCMYCGILGDAILEFDLKYAYRYARIKCPGCDVHNSPTVLSQTAAAERGIWHNDAVETAEPSMKLHPWHLRFSQDSISERFHNGRSVFDPCIETHTILACFHTEAGKTHLFAINNRTLFNALINKVNEVTVNIVEKPFDWERRFTGQTPWMCMRVRTTSWIRRCSASYVRIPSETIAPMGTRSCCLVVLEVRNLVNPKNATFYSLIKDKCPELNVQDPIDVDKAYARVRVAEEEVPLVRSIVKAIAKDLGKKLNTVSCVEVEGLRRFESPRD